METFTEIKGFVHNPHYREQRQKALSRLDRDTIDEPIVELISSFAKLTYCFTLQSCYGHFLHGSQTNSKNVEPLPVPGTIADVEYRIAYIALCIQNDDLGRGLFHDLSEIPLIDPEYIQFGCAEWF